MSIKLPEEKQKKIAPISIGERNEWKPKQPYWERKILNPWNYSLTLNHYSIDTFGYPNESIVLGKLRRLQHIQLETAIKSIHPLK